MSRMFPDWPEGLMLNRKFVQFVFGIRCVSWLPCPYRLTTGFHTVTALPEAQPSL